MKIVSELPKKINHNGKIIINPTPETCLEAGYRTHTPEELAEIQLKLAEMQQEDIQRQQEAEQIQQAKQNEIETLRANYRNITQQICQVLELEQIDKFESFLDIQAASSDVEDPTKVIILMKLSLSLLACDTQLKRLDGDDAWERI